MLATSNNAILFLVEMPLHPSHGGNSRLAEENRILIEFRGIFFGVSPPDESVKEILYLLNDRLVSLRLFRM